MNLQTAPGRFDSIASNYLTSEVHRSSASMSYVTSVFCDQTALRVLDLACGAGHFGFTLAPHAAQLTFCDPSPAMLDAVRTQANKLDLNVETVEGTAESLPFSEGAFDLVVSRLAPHHFFDLDQAMRNMARVLVPRGHCVIVDLEGSFMDRADALNHQLETLHDPTHGRSYTQIEWCRSLRAAGLSIVEVQGGISESDTGVTIHRWCEIAGSGEAARRNIEATLAGADPKDLAALGIWHDGNCYRMPVRTCLIIARKE